jgi:hypothetical protein
MSARRIIYRMARRVLANSIEISAGNGAIAAAEFGHRGATAFLTKAASADFLSNAAAGALIVMLIMVDIR